MAKIKADNPDGLERVCFCELSLNYFILNIKPLSLAVVDRQTDEYKAVSGSANLNIC